VEPRHPVAAQQVRDTEKAVAIAAEEAAEAERIQADRDAAELELRKGAVTEHGASVLKTVGERVKSGLYGEPMSRVGCMPVTGSSIESSMKRRHLQLPRHHCLER
jgi:hypothetical protein